MGMLATMRCTKCLPSEKWWGVLKDILFLSHLQVLSYSRAEAQNLIQCNWNTMPKYFIPDSYLLWVILENLRISLKNKAQSDSWMLKMATTINEGHILASGFINVRYININIYFIFKYKDIFIGFGGFGVWFLFCFVLGWCFCNQRPITRI